MRRRRRSSQPARPAVHPSRREAIRLGALATLGASLVSGAACTSPPSPIAANPGGFLTASELALLDELSEAIIPADLHAPGAKAAKVASFIDARLGEALEDTDRTSWREGLAHVERLSREIASRPFAEASAEQRIAVVARLAKNEGKPALPEEKFFADLKERVVHAYYSSEIGLKQELEYKGNVFLPEFVGEDIS